MDDPLLDEVRDRCAAGGSMAVATVVRTWSSAPRPAGAAMAVDPDGEVLGSISGGCVEGAVYHACQEVLQGAAPRIESYGVSDDDAFSVGLTCGGEMDVLVRSVGPAEVAVLEAHQGWRAADGTPYAQALVMGGPLIGRVLLVAVDGAVGSLGDDGLDAAVAGRARSLLGDERPLALVETFPIPGADAHETMSVFIDPWIPAPALYVFGATDFAKALSRMGAFLGYRVTVCDARAIFATPARFPEAHAVVVDWPHRFLARTPLDARSVICVLTHDPKYDVPALVEALRGPAGYVGAMGSRRTHEDRLQRLREAGLGDTELSRLRSPIGLDLGASSPEETAVAIAAEILVDRRAGTGRALRELDGPIHHVTPVGR